MTLYEWHSLYGSRLTFIRKVRASRSTLEYYRLLMQFAALLKDAHTGVWGPDAVQQQMSADSGLSR